MKGAVPAGIAPIEMPPSFNGVDTSSASAFFRSDGDPAIFAVSTFVTLKMNAGVMITPNLMRAFRKLLWKAIRDIPVRFSDGSAVLFKYAGSEVDPKIQWRPVDGSQTGGDGGGGGGGGEGGTGGGGRGFTFFRVCISGSVSFPGGVSHDLVCFLTLTPQVGEA